MLSKDQEIAYQRICKFINSKETEIILSGSPGTGKSFLIQELSKKFDIDLTATTNKAADVIDGQTIYSYLGIVLKEDYKTGKQTLDTRKAKYIYKKIVVIDECSMINEDLYNALNKFCQGSKIIYVGDWYQLPPVCSNFSIFNQNIETVFLNEIMRTDKEDIKELLSSLKNAITNQITFKDFKESDNIKFIKVSEFKEIVKNFNTPNDMVLGYTNDFVVKMNTFIRCNVFNKPKDFQNGDYVVCKSSALDVFSDSYSRTKIESILKIIKIEGKGDIRKITFNNGNTYFAYLDSNLYRNQLQIIGKDCATKKNFKEYFNFVNRNLEIRDIFVCTTHSSQGSTYNNVVVYLDNLKKCFDYDLLRRMMYVAFSRAKEKIYILVN